MSLKLLKRIYTFFPLRLNKITITNQILGKNSIKVIKVLCTKIIRISIEENFCQNAGEKDFKASTNEINMITLEDSNEEMICN